jgi:hypothetical protein
MRTNAGNERARQQQFLVISNVSHGAALYSTEDNDTLDMFHDLIESFLAVAFKETGAELKDVAPVQYYTIGEEAWHEAQSWPPTNIKNLSLYLGNGPDPDSGFLSLNSQVDTQPVQYVYDPEHSDPCDAQSGLIYSSQPLQEPLIIEGNPKMELYASTSALDTDFFVYLVVSNGSTEWRDISWGSIKTRFRNSYTEPSLTKPGKVYKFTIEMSPISYQVEAGHTLVVAITSSSCTHVENPNTGEKVGFETHRVPAMQTVYGDPSRPSRLVLPTRP